MTERIIRHRLERQAFGWQTKEVHLEITTALLETKTVVLLDCLSLWVSNMLLAEKSEKTMLAELAQLLELQATREHTLIIVSNEVGSGLVPEYALGRTYRDWLGRANQMVAATSSHAYLLVAGLPLKLK